MDFILALGLIAGGALGAAGLIVAKSPGAKGIIEKLQPFQALIGAGLEVLGIYFLVTNISFLTGGALKTPILGACLWAMIVSSIALGTIFGIPMFARLSPSGAQRAERVAAKLLPYQTLFGLIGIASGAAAILLRFHIIDPN